jgi:uncharacterized damage-inducible protein DinB
MRESERIADQLKRAFDGDAWSGPSVRDVLNGVTAEMAFKRPLQDVHSIWELVHHITAWVDIVRRRVEGENFAVVEDINFPPVKDRTETAWSESLRQMEQAVDALQNTILKLQESRLDEITLPHGDSVYILLHGAVQHSLYHAGQIILLKRFWTTLMSRQQQMNADAMTDEQ